MTTQNQNTIKLDQFLKWVGAVQTGGEAKLIIQEGFVKVNGETETRRARKLTKGDSVMVQGKIYKVELS
ncbi:MAG TPA: RNA-binding S4 domain-containing protein [Waterburya sp.]|jgi:ribosome-associated protein